MTVLMRAETQSDTALLGLFEITQQGIIRYHQPAADKPVSGARAKLAGCNFFKEVVPGAEAQELRERIQHFSRSGRPTESFDLALNHAGDDLTVRVVLAAVEERTPRETEHFVLVHIRRA
jgi:hypothetical protein